MVLKPPETEAAALVRVEGTSVGIPKLAAIEPKKDLGAGAEPVVAAPVAEPVAVGNG